MHGAAKRCDLDVTSVAVNPGPHPLYPQSHCNSKFPSSVLLAHAHLQPSDLVFLLGLPGFFSQRPFEGFSWS